MLEKKKPGELLEAFVDERVKKITATQTQAFRPPPGLGGDSIYEAFSKNGKGPGTAPGVNQKQTVKKKETTKEESLRNRRQRKERAKAKARKAKTKPINSRSRKLQRKKGKGKGKESRKGNTDKKSGQGGKGQRQDR